MKFLLLLPLSPVAGLTQQERDDVLDCTNILRCMHGSPPVEYSLELEKEGQKRLDRKGPGVDPGHASQQEMDQMNDWERELSEILASPYPTAWAKDGIRDKCIGWYSESWWYQGDGNCKGICGHWYAQIWKPQTKMGCAAQTGGGSLGCWFERPVGTPGPGNGNEEGNAAYWNANINWGNGKPCEGQTQDQCEARRDVNPRGNDKFCIQSHVMCGRAPEDKSVGGARSINETVCTGDGKFLDGGGAEQETANKATAAPADPATTAAPADPANAPGSSGGGVKPPLNNPDGDCADDEKDSAGELCECPKRKSHCASTTAGFKKWMINHCKKTCDKCT